MQPISIGKNTVRILDHEFPIDQDLSFLKYQDKTAGWKSQSAHVQRCFDPIVNNEISKAAFATYRDVFRQSTAFSSKSKLRKLFDRKEEGHKVIPGHGVFILPSKMTVLTNGPKLKLIVFRGTSLQQSFESTDYKRMTIDAGTYYFEHIKEVTHEINESLWYPVKYNLSWERHLEQEKIPDGVSVTNIKSGYRVRCYDARIHRDVHVGSTSSFSELASILREAENMIENYRKEAAMYRFVNPTYVPLSQYMRSI